MKFDNKSYKFKFKWSEDMVEFGEGFVFSGYLYMDKNNDLSFSDTSFQASFRQNFAYFNEPELSYTDFFMTCQGEWFLQLVINFKRQNVLKPTHNISYNFLPKSCWFHNRVQCQIRLP